MYALGYSGCFLFEESIDGWGGGAAESLIKCAFLALEDKDFQKADEFCEQALNCDPEHAWAYLGKLLAELKLPDIEHLHNYKRSFVDSKNYKKLMRFADEPLKAELAESIYSLALEKMEQVETVADYVIVIKLLRQVTGVYAEAREKLEECQEARNELIYKKAKTILARDGSINTLKEAEHLFSIIADWRDAEEKCQMCMKRIQELQIDLQQRQKQYKERIEEDEKSRRIRAYIIWFSTFLIIIIAVIIILRM